MTFVCNSRSICIFGYPLHLSYHPSSRPPLPSPAFIVFVHSYILSSLSSSIIPSLTSCQRHIFVLICLFISLIERLSRRLSFSHRLKFWSCRTACSESSGVFSYYLSYISGSPIAYSRVLRYSRISTCLSRLLILTFIPG